MIKRYEFSSIADDGEPLVIPVGTDLTKHASSVLPELVDYLGTLPEPAKDMIRTVITALSSFEGFGPNRNGDAWLEDHLLRDNEYKKDGVSVTAPMYKSFEHFARPYKYHVNRPDSPAYGDVLKSFYNPSMKRVELVVEWDRSKAPDICERLEKYEPVSTSIGFRCMPVDVCSVCGNPAKTRREYCAHLKREMLQVQPDGRMTCAINPKGMFFDISMVDDPADRTSRAVAVDRIMGDEEPKYTVNEEPVKVASARFQYKSWMSSQMGALADMGVKIAEAQEDVAEKDVQPENPGGEVVEMKEKGTSVQPENPGGETVTFKADKISDIIKRIQASVEMRPEEVESLARGAKAIKAPRLKKEALQSLAQFPIKEAIATSIMMGIDLYPEEVQYIGLYGDHPKLANKLYDHNLVVTVKEAEAWNVGETPMNLELAEKLVETGIVAERSMWQPWRVEQMAKQAYFGQNPYTAPTEVPFGELQGIMPDQGMSTATKMGLIASLMLGATLLTGDDPVIKLPGTPTQRTIALVGLAGLAGWFTGKKDGREITRMPMMDMRRQQMAQPQLGLRQAMSGPLAYNMLFGKTAGVLTAALQKHEGALKLAASRISAMTPFVRTEKRIKLGSLSPADLTEFYEEPLLDAMLMNEAGSSW